MKTKTDTEEENVDEKVEEEKEVKSQTLDAIIRENSGLFCNFCPWGPAKTKTSVDSGQ